MSWVCCYQRFHLVFMSQSRIHVTNVAKLSPNLTQPCKKELISEKIYKLYKLTIDYEN